MNLKEVASHCKRFLDYFPVKERSTENVMKVFGLLFTSLWVSGRCCELYI